MNLPVNDKLHFGFNHRTKAGHVTGTVTVYVEGPADGIAVAVERITRHVMALPVDEVEAVPKRALGMLTEREAQALVSAAYSGTMPAVPTWESEALRMADESGIDGDDDEVGD